MDKVGRKGVVAVKTGGVMCVSWADKEVGGCDTNVRLFGQTAKKVKQDRIPDRPNEVITSRQCAMRASHSQATLKMNQQENSIHRREDAMNGVQRQHKPTIHLKFELHRMDGLALKKWLLTVLLVVS